MIQLVCMCVSVLRTLLVLKTVWGRQLPTTVGRDGPDGRGGRPRPAPMPRWAAGRVRAWAGPCPLHGAGPSGHRAALRLVRALGAGGGAVWRVCVWDGQGSAWRKRVARQRLAGGGRTACDCLEGPSELLVASVSGERGTRTAAALW